MYHAARMALLGGRGWLLAPAGVLALLVALWWWQRSSPGEFNRAAERGAEGPWASRAPSQQADSLRPSAASIDDAFEPPVPIPSADLSDPAARAIAAAKLDETIRIYRKTMAYPLASRPADHSNAHLTRWNEPITTGQPFAVDAAKREIQATARIDRIFASPGQAVSLRLTTSYVDDNSPAEVETVGAELQWRDRKNDEWLTAQALPLHREAGSWVGAVIPSEVAALREPIREARILAFVRIGEFERELSLDFSYAVEQPVVIRRLVSDRLVDGSLELGLEADLATAAPVALNATLFAADGTTPIAVFDDRYFPVRAGRQIIPVQVFGKVLHDRGIDGPYHLGAIHGYVYRRDLVPDQLFFDRAEQPALKTAAHAASNFSPAAYQSPAVAARIAHYEALRDAMREGRLPPPPPAL